MRRVDRYGTCPCCGGSWGYEKGGQHYSNLLAIEIPGVYDGVAYWSCPFCAAAWHRFDVGDSRRARLEQVVAQWPVEAQPSFKEGVA